MTIVSRITALANAVGADIKALFQNYINLANGKVIYLPRVEITTVEPTDTIPVAYDVGMINVYVDGILVRGGGVDYTATNGTTIVFNSELAADVRVDVERISVENSLTPNPVALYIGEYRYFSTADVPDGWLRCNGQAVSRATYPLLFAKIGTTYGVGDGSTTFNVPNHLNSILTDNTATSTTIGAKILLSGGLTPLSFYTGGSPTSPSVTPHLTISCSCIAAAATALGNTDGPVLTSVSGLVAEMGEFSTAVGDLTALDTTAKDSLVGAINEVVETVEGLSGPNLGPFPAAVMTTVVPLTSAWDDYDNAGDGFYTNTDYLNNPHSVGLTTRVASGRAATVKELTGLSLTGKDLRILVKCSNWAATSNAALSLGSDSYALSNRFIVDFKARLQNPPNNEWIELIVPIAGTAFEGTVDLADIDIAFLILRDNGTERVTLTINAVESFSKTSTPMVSICVDDGLLTTIPAKELMESHGWVGTLFVAHDDVGTTNFMSQAQIDWFAAAGWDIGGHSSLNMTSLSAPDLANYLQASSDYLKGNDYKGSDLFAYPYGAWNNGVIDALENHFSAAFNIDGYTQPVSYVAPYRINRHSIDRYTTVAMVQGWVNQAIADGAWCILNFHTFVDTLVDDVDWLTSDFETLLNFIDGTNVAVLPISEAVAVLRGTVGGAIDAYTKAEIGDFASLTTTDKTTIVNAINEVKTAVDAGGVTPEFFYVVNCRSTAPTTAVTLGTQIPGAPAATVWAIDQLRLHIGTGDIYKLQAGGTWTLSDSFGAGKLRFVHVMYGGPGSPVAQPSGLRIYRHNGVSPVAIITNSQNSVNVLHAYGTDNINLFTQLGNLSTVSTNSKTSFVNAISEAKYPFTSARWVTADFTVTSFNWGGSVVIGDPIPGTAGKTFQEGTIGVSTSFGGTLGNAYYLQSDGTWIMYQELADNGYQNVVTTPLAFESGYNSWSGLLIFRREGSYRELALTLPLGGSMIKNGPAVNDYVEAADAIGVPSNLTTTSKELVGSINEAIENKGIASKTDTTTTAGLVAPTLQNIVQKYSPSADASNAVRYTGIRKFEYDSLFSITGAAGGVIVGLDWYRHMSTGTPGVDVSVHESRIDVEAAATIPRLAGNTVKITNTGGTINSLVGNRVSVLSNTGTILNYTGYAIDHFSSAGTLQTLKGFVFPNLVNLTDTVRTSFLNQDPYAPVISVGPIIDQSVMISAPAATGFTVNVSVVSQFLILRPDAVYATGTINFPPAGSGLRDGHMLTVSSDKDVTAVTWGVVTGSVGGAPDGLIAKQMVVFKYILSTNAWVCINSPTAGGGGTPVSGPPIALSTYSLSKDASGIYTVVEQKTAAGVLYSRSTLTGGTSPKYTTRTIAYYDTDGTTVLDTRVFTLSYDGDDVVAEVLT